ncbi:MAG: Crp/Fnr family transcriptional regulator [Pseudomonadota bacterium]
MARALVCENPPERPVRDQGVTCLTCPIGISAGISRGGRCPFVDRPRSAGEYLYFEGEPAVSIWFIKRGTVVLARSVSGVEEEESACGIRRTGDFLGLEALIRPGYLFTARTTSESRLCGASLEIVSLWLGPPDSPARVALDQVLRTLCTDSPRAASPDGSAVHRVARWLLDESQNGFAPPVPRRFVASLLGMVPETLSRALAELARTGAIEVSRRALRIRSRHALIVAAGSTAGSTAAPQRPA